MVINRPQSKPTVVPEANKPENTPAISQQPKFTWAKFVERCQRETGYTEEEIKTILDRLHITYEPARYWDAYFRVTLTYRRTTEEMVTPVGGWDRFYQFCPVCGSPTMRDETRDHKFGCLYGWKCIANDDHFMTWRWEHLKGFMTRNQGDITDDDKIWANRYVESTGESNRSTGDQRGR